MIQLEKGYLRTNDLPGAMKYYKMSADHGNSKGINNYGFGLERISWNK
jgi:hypothetical protein